MIIQLSINNIALIKRISVEIGSGMTVLTGETGAGKSIIIDSINMILGDRTKKELVRSGEEKAVIQAVFDVSDTLLPYLSEMGIDTEENQLVITREITESGKSVCRMNGMIVTLSALRSFAAHLVNIHGQHDNQALLDPKKHIHFIDEYGGCAEFLAEYKDEYENYCGIKGKIEKLSIDESERIRRLDLLKYQISEIETAKLTAGEDSELEEQRDMISNAELIKRNTQTAYENLYGGESVQSAYDGLSIAIQSLEEIKEYGSGLSDIAERLTDAMYQVEEAAHEINDRSGSVEYDEQALDDIEERLDMISKLKRKYGGSIEKILEYLGEIKEECSGIENSDELSEKLRAELSESEKRLLLLAKKLSDKRCEAARTLKSDICEALSDLDMGTCEFDIKLSDTGVFTPSGRDEAEFFISTNKGEEPKPLDRVASGGELSRVMLALKSVLADSDNVDTLIFDEIDTGVSGSAAKKIAVKLAKIARHRQVICISHLPQIASMADNHFYISKSVVDGRTETAVKLLTEDERPSEIARITDGDITETSMKHAREMIESSEKVKSMF